MLLINMHCNKFKFCKYTVTDDEAGFHIIHQFERIHEHTIPIWCFPHSGGIVHFKLKFHLALKFGLATTMLLRKHFIYMT